MKIAVQIEPASGSPAAVDYRWDEDTDILTATVREPAAGEGLSGTVELQGSDGSWLNLDVTAGRIHGIEVAVWPNVRKLSTLAPPSEIEHVRVTVPAGRAPAAVVAMEIHTPLLAEADRAERTIHFRLGGTRPSRTVRLASDILLDLDEQGRIGGLWLLNVPPFPTDS